MEKYYFVRSRTSDLKGNIGQHPSEKIQVYLTEEDARQACTSNENSIFSLVLEPTLGLIEEEEGQFFLNCSKIPPEGLFYTCILIPVPPRVELVAGPSESMEVDEFGSMVATDAQPVATSSRVMETDSHSMEFDRAEKGALPSGPVFGPSSDGDFENDELDDRLLSSQGQASFDFEKTIKTYLRNTKGLTDDAIKAYTSSMPVGEQEYQGKERASYVPSGAVGMDIDTEEEVRAPHAVQDILPFDQITDAGIIRAINLLRCLDMLLDEASKNFMLFAVLAYDYSWRPGNGELRDQLFAAYTAASMSNAQGLNKLASDEVYQHFYGNPELELDQSRLQYSKAVAKRNKFLSPLLSYDVDEQSARKKEYLDMARMIGKSLSEHECNIDNIKTVVDIIHKPSVASSVRQTDSRTLDQSSVFDDAAAQSSNPGDQDKFDFKATIKAYLRNTKRLTNAAIETYTSWGKHVPSGTVSVGIKTGEEVLIPHAKQVIPPFDQITDAGIIRAINLLRFLDMYPDAASKNFMLFAVLAYDYSWKPGNGDLRDQLFAAYKNDPENHAQDMKKLTTDDIYQHFFSDSDVELNQSQSLKATASHNRFFSPLLNYDVDEQSARKKEYLDMARMIGRSLSERGCSISSINEAITVLDDRSLVNQQQRKSSMP